MADDLNIADSTEDSDAFAGGGAGEPGPAGPPGVDGMVPSLIPGWYSTPPGETDTVTITPGSMFAVPFPIYRDVAFDRMGIEVTGTDATTVVRVGIYTDADSAPADLIADYGTLSCAAAAFVEKVIDEEITAQKAWLAICAQVGVGNVAVRAVRWVAPTAVPSAGYAPYSRPTPCARAGPARPAPSQPRRRCSTTCAPAHPD